MCYGKLISMGVLSLVTMGEECVGIGEEGEIGWTIKTNKQANKTLEMKIIAEVLGVHNAVRI